MVIFGENRLRKEKSERGEKDMLSGIYEHNIDGKNRVFVPAKFREIMGDDYTYKLCPSKYPSIQLFSREYYNKLYPQTELDTLNPIRDRGMRAGRNLGKGETSCDGQGRISISPLISKLAKLEKQCVFVGFETYVEIMSPEVYEAFLLSQCEDYQLEEESYRKEESKMREYRSEGAFIALPENQKGGDNS